MKFFDSCRYIGLKAPRGIFMGVVLVILCLAVGTASAASGEGGGGKGWVATDTYRVMNFVVLLAALIFLLRKPMSQALSSRIKTIKEQLESLETQKAEAEKKFEQTLKIEPDLLEARYELLELYKQQKNEAKVL